MNLRMIMINYGIDNMGVKLVTEPCRGGGFCTAAIFSKPTDKASG
jgi:hypothetical protein